MLNRLFLAAAGRSGAGGEATKEKGALHLSFSAIPFLQNEFQGQRLKPDFVARLDGPTSLPSGSTLKSGPDTCLVPQKKE